MDVDRIRQVLLKKREEKGLSAQALGKQVGVDKTTIYRYEKGQIEKMPFTVVNRLADILNINPAFIAGFTDDPDINENAGNSLEMNISTLVKKLTTPRQEKVYSFTNAQYQEQEQLKEQKNDNVVSLDKFKEEKQRHDIDLQSKVSAGRGVVDLDPNTSETITYYGKLPRHFDLAFQVDGNSMEPVFENGDIIFVEKMDEVINGALMVVTVDDEAFIKKVYYDSDCIRLVSLNREYDDILATEGVKIIGKVVF